MEKKIQDLLENDEKLQKEIETLKSDRDKRMMDNQRNVEKERENWKSKYSELEQKHKDIEGKRTLMIIEH